MQKYVFLDYTPSFYAKFILKSYEQGRRPPIFYKFIDFMISSAFAGFMSCYFFNITLLSTYLNKGMKKIFFKYLSKLNKKLLPSYSKQRLDLSKANTFQKAIIGWKLWVTKRALGD